MERITPDRGVFSQRDLLPLLRVKPHVLRYWEQTLPLVRSRRDDTGRRIWSAAQVRMLVRIRHLVVERGVSVPAAGETLLREAGGETARTKAGLERLRNALIVLLLKTQTGGRRTTSTADERAGKTVDQLESESEADGGGLHLENFIDRGIIPGYSSVREPPKTPRVRFRSAGAPVSGCSVRLLYSHLFVRGDPARVARTLSEIVRHRLSREVPAERGEPLIVAAPTGEEAFYRDAFTPRSETDPETHILSIPPVVIGNSRYENSTLSVLTTVAADRELDRRLGAWKRETLHIWAADSPYSPASDYLSPVARGARCGIALGIRRSVNGYRLAESVALYLPAWRPRFEETVRCGRWRPIGGVSVNRTRHNAEIADMKLRYVVWLRDLAGLDPPGVLMPDTNLPGVWRGSFWQDQVRHVWPGIDALTER